MKGYATRTLVCAAFVAGLSGCAGLEQLVDVTTPSELYTLTPKSTFSTTLPQIAQQIVVEEPTATAAVSTDQIAVQPTPLRVQYLPGARWVDRAPSIVQQLLIESFENSDRVQAVGSSTIGLRADYFVATDIREFQARLPDGSAPDTPLEIHVRLNLKLIDAREDRIIGSRSFEEFVQSQSDEAADVAAAFDDALGGTMRDAVEWSIRRIYSHARAREVAETAQKVPDDNLRAAREAMPSQAAATGPSPDET